MENNVFNEEDEGKLTRVVILVEKYQKIIRNMYVHIQNQKLNDIIKQTDMGGIIEDLNLLMFKCNAIESLCFSIENYNIMLEDLQSVNDNISTLIKQYGSLKLDELLFICYSDLYLLTLEFEKKELYNEVFNDYFVPIGYKTIQLNDSKETTNKNKTNKTNKTNSIFEDFNIAEEGNTLDIFDLGKQSKDNFTLKLNGVKVIFKNDSSNECLLVQGYLKDIPISYLKTEFILQKKTEIIESIPENFEDEEIFLTYINSLTLKEILLHDVNEYYEIFQGYKHFVKMLKKKSLSKITREFMTSELIEQRDIIYQMLLFSEDLELQFLCYLLYDLLSLDSTTSEESNEQLLIFDSLPHNIRQKFKIAMRETITYTAKLSNPDLQNDLPLEQRICIMKTGDNVKEKAMNKLKELKAKAEDSGSKARQYLDGILKIPFGLYREEPVLELAKTNITLFEKFIKSTYNPYIYEINKKSNYNSSEVVIHCKKYLKSKAEKNTDSLNKKFINCVYSVKQLEKKDIIHILDSIQHTVDHFDSINSVPYYSDIFALEDLQDILISILTSKTEDIFKDYICAMYEKFDYNKINEEDEHLVSINNNCKRINNYFKEINSALNKSVHGHKNAKKQVERIIGQWINGEQTGYCFGFEGPPGVGKTSLAKHGISHCLKDEEGNSRPFAFIAIGGSSNGSTLDGHNYTYVGSMWGKIVDVLMETKCMNPIIFIDEVDKISRTENGREIIGILTHLVDPTQNDSFQDKYFSGIDLDLSKALFIFSYNDAELMDRILLDRIHRIKFEHLSIEEKLTICEEYMLPEIYKKMGQEGNIIINSEILKFLIEKYTCEAGVRKLKEILFEIVGEINLELIQNIEDITLPFELTLDDIKNKYLKERNKIRPKTIHTKSSVGIINGLWANALGKGGVIPIEMKYILASNLLELKLTGMQGDVMKESMSVAKTLAWSLTKEKRRERLMKEYDNSKLQGIHIHCPDGATPKDGPSAGTAITVTLYSLLNDIKIKNTVAITGEMNLQGNVTAIGGLDLKILGGIEAGVKEFLFPKENLEDFEKFREKYENNSIIDNIIFRPIETIKEALEFALEK